MSCTALIKPILWLSLLVVHFRYFRLHLTVWIQWGECAQTQTEGVSLWGGRSWLPIRPGPHYFKLDQCPAPGCGGTDESRARGLLSCCWCWSCGPTRDWTGGRAGWHWVWWSFRFKLLLVTMTTKTKTLKYTLCHVCVCQGRKWIST